MKSPLKLLILIAAIVTIAVPAGWKWGTKPKAARALTYAVAPADANAPDSSTSPDASLAPADANAPDSITPPSTSVNPDGWTWDTGE
ncbi:MAG: hypothetical protein ACXVY6_14005 [Gaiellaceae bacterium]